MNTMEKRSNVTTLKIAVFFFLVGCSARLFVSSTAQAALLTVGRPGNTPYGGQVCADVRSASITPGIAVQDYDCFGDLNEQFELFGLKIYALGNTRCLDVSGISVVSNTCSSSVSQEWYYFNGEIVNNNTGECLDGTTLANNRQLVINPCNGASSQSWQIK